jgi:hypothetical protein
VVEIPLVGEGDEACDGSYSVVRTCLALSDRHGVSARLALGLAATLTDHLRSELC